MSKAYWTVKCHYYNDKKEMQRIFLKFNANFYKNYKQTRLLHFNLYYSMSML